MALLIIYCVFLSTLFYFSLCFACSCLLLRFAFRLTSRFRHQQSVSPCCCTYTVSSLSMQRRAHYISGIRLRADEILVCFLCNGHYFQGLSGRCLFKPEFVGSSRRCCCDHVHAAFLLLSSPAC